VSPFALVPLTTRLEARISAIRMAPVRAAPIPKRAATAGTRISEANASPVPNSKALELEGADTAKALLVAIAETSNV
jgi:hypothetical protein